MTRIHGYIRFSYLGRSDAQATHNKVSEDERAALLYAPLRMEQRFHLFEHICLPSLRAQTHRDFRIVVLTSPQMPPVYQERLQSLVATLPHGEVLFGNGGTVIEALNPSIAAVTAKAKGMTYHFRLDDDDAMCKTAIETMDHYCDIAVPHELLSFPGGFLLTSEDGVVRLLRKHEDYIAIGLGFFAAPGAVHNPYYGAHRKVYRRFPSRMEPRLPAYIHVAHVASDTAGRANVKLAAALNQDPNHANEQEAIDRLLKKHFPFDVQQLHRIMETLPVDAPLAPGPASG